MRKPAPLPVFRFTIDLKVDKPDEPAQRIVEATQYGIDGGWFVFDDAVSTVLSIRQEKVVAIHRGEKIGEQGPEILP